jgi:hypothetical protein
MFVLAKTNTLQLFRYREASRSCPDVLFHGVHNLKLHKIRNTMYVSCNTVMRLGNHFSHKKKLKYFLLVLLNNICRCQ